MNTNQVQDLKNSILNNNNQFEACIVGDESYKGIKILGVKKVPVHINADRHHVFIDLGSYRGADFWADSGGKSYFFDKPSNEVATNIPLFNSQSSFRLRGKDGSYSQDIVNLDFNHSKAGHSSFYVFAVFTATMQPVQPVVPVVPILPVTPTLPIGPIQPVTPIKVALTNTLNKMNLLIKEFTELVAKL